MEHFHKENIRVFHAIQKALQRQRGKDGCEITREKHMFLLSQRADHSEQGKNCLTSF